MLDNMRTKVLNLAEESKDNNQKANERLIEIFNNNSDFPGFAEEFAGKEFKDNLKIALKGIEESMGELNSLQAGCDKLIKKWKNREKARREKYDRVYNSLFGSLENLECRVEDEIKEINERIKAFEAGQKNHEKGDIKNEDINYEEEDNNQFNDMTFTQNIEDTPLFKDIGIKNINNVDMNNNNDINNNNINKDMNNNNENEQIEEENYDEEEQIEQIENYNGEENFEENMNNNNLNDMNEQENFDEEEYLKELEDMNNMNIKEGENFEQNANYEGNCEENNLNDMGNNEEMRGEESLKFDEVI